MARQRIPGLSLAVLSGDRIVMSRGYGFANVELRVPASDSTIYQSGSMGKQFTAALVETLVGQQRLRLDDPLVARFPEGATVWKGIHGWRTTSPTYAFCRSNPPPTDLPTALTQNQT